MSADDQQRPRNSFLMILGILFIVAGLPLACLFIPAGGGMIVGGIAFIIMSKDA